MDLFLCRYTNLIDKKGRVSIPSAYRSVLNTQNSTSIIIYPSLKNKCIEVWPKHKMQDMIKIIDKLEPFSKERDAFQTVIFSECLSLSLDSEGRVSIPKNMLENMQISDKLTFVGKGSVFEIWSPELFELHLENSKKLAEENLKRLTW